MATFRESTKKQFDSRQVQVKQTITALRERFEENQKEREEIHHKKMDKLIKQKDSEKQEAVTTMKRQMQQDFTNRLKDFNDRHDAHTEIEERI